MARIRKNKKPLPENTAKVDGGYILEESDQTVTTNGHLAYNFLSGIRSIDANYTNNDLLIEKMCSDSVISAALDIWTEDALQKDPLTGEIFNVEVESADDDLVAKKLAEGLAQRLNKLLKIDLNMEKYLANYTKRILKYGNCMVKLDFADALVDERLKLKETSVDSKNIYTKVALKLCNILNESNDSSSTSNTTRSFDHPLKMLNDGALADDYKVDYEYMLEHCTIDDIDESTKKVLTEEILSGEKKEKTVRGRWYTEVLGHGTNIYELSSKQMVIAYIDRDAPNKFIKPANIINFSNNTGKHRVSFEVGDIYEDANQKEYYQLERGESFIENAMVAWQVLSALEDILLLTRMSRSILYRIFSVEVGNKDNKETARILDRLKNRLKLEETEDIRSKIYSSTLAQVPLADSVFIPTRNGVGVTDVKTIGGDVNLRDAVDLDYFRDKLHSALRIPAPYLSYTESLPGGIGDSSLTRMDIRYSRTIARIQSILAEGLKDICIRYLELTIGKKALNELPRFKVKFTSINSAEDASRAELQQTFMKTLSESLEGLKALGVDIASNPEGYKNTREQLLSQYFGAILLEKIKKDEELMNVSSPQEMAKSSDSSANLDFGENSDSGGVDINIDNSQEEPSIEEPAEEPAEEPSIEPAEDMGVEPAETTNELS